MVCGETYSGILRVQSILIFLLLVFFHKDPGIFAFFIIPAAAVVEHPVFLVLVGAKTHISQFASHSGVFFVHKERAYCI